MNPVESIASVLTLCGIASLRNFAPLFIFGLAARSLPQFAWCPEGTREVLSSAPAWLTGNTGLCVFGLLAILEIAANWNDVLRNFIEESGLESYVKPVLAFCAAFALLSPEQTEVAEQALGSALPDRGAVSFADYAWPIALSAGGSVWTWCLCKVRLAIARGLRMIDPRNSLGLHWLAALTEESLWFLALVVLVAIPVLAAAMVLLAGVTGWMFRKVLVRAAERRRRFWDSLGAEEAVRRLDARMVAVCLAGAAASAVPVAGFILTLVVLNVMVFGVFRLYEGGGRRILSSFMLRFAFVLVLLIGVFVSGVPFAGLLALSPYLALYAYKRRRFLEAYGSFAPAAQGAA